MTVWVVEPELFSAYALERRLRDLRAETVVLVRNAGDARARLRRGETPAVAIVDCAERTLCGRDLADALRERDVAVVRTVDPDDGVPGEPWDVAKPYALIDVERAIARHYGLTI